MDRAELERLDRDALIRRAEEAGVARPSILTRPELVDELLLRSAPRATDPTLRRVRGLFGVARDLLASVIDRGLHLPDAAERIRSLRGPAEPSPAQRAPAVLPTVTLAEIYAAQGHRARAVDTLERVLEREPEHAAARSLLGQLKDASFTVPEPALPPETEEDASVTPDESAEAPAAAAAVAPAPPEAHAYETDACVALPVDPTTLFVAWELSEPTLQRARHAAGPGPLVLHVLVAVPTWDGPRMSTRELEVLARAEGQWLRDLPAGAVSRVAIGVRAAGGFVPLAHSAAFEGALESGPSGLARWTPDGLAALRADDADAAAVGRALEHPALLAARAGSTNGARVATRPS